MPTLRLDREESTSETPAMPIDVPILFVGDATLPKFAPIASWLTSRNAQFAADVSAAVARIAAGFTPTLIVVAQPWPGHVSAAQIESLRQAAPLARFASLLGTWLEGEARTGKPWPAVCRTYWHAWLPRLAAELDRLALGEGTMWSLPPTAGDEERLLHVVFRESATKSATSTARSIAIISANRETAESLSDVCRHRSWKPLWFKSQAEALHETIDLAIFDARNLHESEIAQISNLKFQISNFKPRVSNLKSEISNLKSEISGVPFIVLAGFPRIADVERLKLMGIAAVVSKPFLNRELAWQIDQLLTTITHAA